MKTVTKPQLSKLSSNQILSESTALYENYRLKFLLLVYLSTSLTSTSKSLQNFLFLAFFHILQHWQLHVMMLQKFVQKIMILLHDD